jgi:limonene-1,2-epoxide hydrolase
MTSRDEVDAAFRHYFLTGPVNEDWEAWAHLFTDDAVYTEHFWGTFHGPEEILAFIEGTLASAPQVYTVLDWYLVDGDRVAHKTINRADNPQVGGPPIDFPSFQFLTYAGDGRWCAEEDVWVMTESKLWGMRYAEACATHDPGHASKMTRLDWGHVEWARPAPGHAPRPSWLGRTDLHVVRGLRDIVVGERVPREPRRDR